VLSLVLLSTVYTLPATQKVRPTDPPATAASIAIAAAKNEFEAFQVVVHGGTTGARNVRMIGSLPALPAANLRLYREALLNLGMPSNPAGAAGPWPDPLIPDVDEIYGETRNAFPFDVPAGQNRAVWVEVLVPPGQRAGDYSGSVRVTADGGFASDVPFTLTVFDFALPSTPSLKSIYQSGWADVCIAHYGARCDDAGTVASHLLYARFALDHRVTLADVVYTGPTPQGAGWDWASWDATYAPLFDGSAATRLAGARATSIQYEWSQDLAHYSAWADHLRARGWIDRAFDYTCDEPPVGCAFAQIAPRAQLVHQADPGLRTLVTMSLATAEANGLAADTDLLVPLVADMNPRSPDVDHRADYDAWLGAAPQRGLGWYFSCTPSSSCINAQLGGEGGWPNLMVDAPAIENRIMGWLSYRYRVTTELYYDTTYMYTHGDPWQSVYAYGNNGDGTLFYPGKPSVVGGTRDIPIASLRLKMVREGREDYEYLRMLADAGDPGLASQLAAQVAAKTWQFVEDPAVLYAARQRAAERIVELSQPPPPPVDAGVDQGSPPDAASDAPPHPPDSATPDAGRPDAAPPQSGIGASTQPAGGCSAAPTSGGAGGWLLLLLGLSKPRGRTGASARNKRDSARRTRG
jgi:hypothetical protein